MAGHPALGAQRTECGLPRLLSPRSYVQVECRQGWRKTLGLQTPLRISSLPTPMSPQLEGRGRGARSFLLDHPQGALASVDRSGPPVPGGSSARPPISTPGLAGPACPRGHQIPDSPLKGRPKSPHPKKLGRRSPTQLLGSLVKRQHCHWAKSMQLGSPGAASDPAPKGHGA